MNNLFEYSLKTYKNEEFLDITDLVRKSLKESKVQNGTLTVFCPHTTAGITINENTDPDVASDIIQTLNKVFPIDWNYKHAEGNSHAHIKSSLMGASCTVIVEDGKLKLGIWQGIYFTEFDGPRNRNVYVKIVPDNQN
ncbi:MULTISPECIES: secondary thiamine-phosphate synthase enzyme YjbQ [Clostridium]|uniref:secondary thiamine-phosphate synthase enzyme YjbQ n=1 Tax=Clostridium TaxID=1485 RepID=UPI00069FBE93|nr:MULTISPECIES: secondary thiamine-phosphate synthase enzyme YjbQ [Clostridium]KOF56890.1 hypothetical protein AGR56_09725 [Clostridium sp. DMHC 10]MCD2347319.1 secondary thiamine-phosphate synthase enzyme YjbQ [Clostridium guangxiense]